MDIGFEVVAAKPKGLYAEEPPASESMRGTRTLTKNPSTDQKKVRRQQQRKTASMDFTAAMNDVGDCRLCGGDLKAQESQKGDSGLRASCQDCGTTHMLQGKPLERSAALAEADSVDEATMRRLASVSTWEHIEKGACPDCSSTGFGTKRIGGFGETNANDLGKVWDVLCKDCGHHYKVSDKDARAAKHDRKHAALEMLGYAWVPQMDTSQYVTGGKPLSAIARRAHAVLGTPEGSL